MTVTRWALLVEYDGTDFVGWQRQTNGASVQEALETALGRLTGECVRVDGAGRTDAGVHARGQVAAFSTARRLGADNVTRGGNAYLPAVVRIRAAREVAPPFDPRRAAVRRHYRYRLAVGGVPPALERTTVAWIKDALDWGGVAEALERMRGAHDFRAFRASGCAARRTFLDLERAEVRVEPRGPGEEFGVVATFDFECRSFLYAMVRRLVGAAVEFGRGRLSRASLEGLLRGETAGVAGRWTAASRGLCLMAVRYPSRLGLWEAPRGRPAVPGAEEWD